MSSFLGVPVAVGDTAFGNLYLTDKSGGFTDQDVIVIEALSRIAGAAVRTARLQDRLRRMAVIEDRQRIARDLHDSVIQDLFAVGLGLQGVSQLVDDPQAEATIVEAVDRLDGAVETLRSYIFDLKTTGSQPALQTRLDDLVSQIERGLPDDSSFPYGSPGDRRRRLGLRDPPHRHRDPVQRAPSCLRPDRGHLDHGRRRPLGDTGRRRWNGLRCQRCKLGNGIGQPPGPAEPPGWRPYGVEPSRVGHRGIDDPARQVSSGATATVSAIRSIQSLTVASANLRRATLSTALPSGPRGGS